MLDEMEMRRRKQLGRWLARLRNQAGLSQPALARKIVEATKKPFDHSSIAHWELGTKIQNADVLPAIAAALGVTLDELLKVRHTAKGYVPRPDDELPPKSY